MKCYKVLASHSLLNRPVVTEFNVLSLSVAETYGLRMILFIPSRLRVVKNAFSASENQISAWQALTLFVRSSSTATSQYLGP
jgi:hypothetical protein